MTGQPRPRRAPAPQIWSSNIADYPFAFVVLGNGTTTVRCRPGLTTAQKRAIATAMIREANTLGGGVDAVVAVVAEAPPDEGHDE